MLDFIKPNEIEAGQLAGMQVTDEASARECMDILRGLGYRDPLITLGKDGCLAWTGREAQRLLPPKVNAIDTTAAGRRFSRSVYSGAFKRKGDSGKAVSFASVASAISTTVKGAQTSIPTREQVEAFMEQERIG